MQQHFTELEQWKLGYLAGMIDAECHIGMQRQLPSRSNGYKTPAYSIRFELAMTDRASVEFVNSLMQAPKIIRMGAKGRRLPYYRLRIIQQECLELLRATLPYVQGKRRQIELCLELDALRRQYSPQRAHFGKARFQPMPDEFVEQAEKLFREFRKRQLNKKPRQLRL